MRKKPTKTTTQRGLGHLHQKRVAQLKKRHRPGTPCRRCGKPMMDVKTLQGGHRDGQERALGGGHLPDALEHARCNMSAGATFGHKLLGHRVTPERVWVEPYRADGW